MRLYGTLQKIDKEQRMVWGYASTENKDAHGETITKGAIEAALDDYLEFANIREMHQLSAVGTAEETQVDDKGLYLGAKIVDDVAWQKVTSGVYKGFSVGGKVLARDPDNKKIITKIRLDEISLVDRPSNPEAVFDVWKAAGLRETGVGADLAKRLSDTETALAKIADRVAPLATIITELSVENANLRKSNADLVKRLAGHEKPRVIAGSAADDAFKRCNSIVEALEQKLRPLEASTVDIKNRIALLECGGRFNA
jgi:HK97 family phage prohead protease